MRRIVPMLAVVALAGCADSMPVELTRAPAPHLSAVSSPALSKYVVVFRGGAPSDFEATVASRGGTIELLHHGAGIAIVAGLSSEGALAIERSANVDGIVEDFEYQGVSHLEEPAIEVASFESPEAGIQTQAAPATAFFYPRQWHHRAIGANVAWAANRLGSPNVDVAILDSGIDPTYPDLAGLVDQGRARSFVPEGSLALPFPADSVARDNHLIAKYFPGPARPSWIDLNGHGTHVASTVSSLAIVNAGVTSMVKLIPVKVLSARGSGAFSGIVNGILYATDAGGAEVINMSLGALYPRAGNRAFNKQLDAVTKYAWKSGVTIVVAAGNDAQRLHPSNNGLYDAFCSTKNVICVSATGPNRATTANGPYFPSVDLYARYTNYGIQHIDVAAPGGNSAAPPGQPATAVFVWAGCSKTWLTFTRFAGNPPPPPAYRKNACSLNPNSHFTVGFLGTSMASPHVAGLAALLVEDLGRNPEVIKSTIARTADDIVGEFGWKPGKDDLYGNGRINVPRALGL